MASRKTSRRRQHETQDSSRRQGRWAEEQEPARARGQAATLGALQHTGFYRVAPSPRHQHAQRQQHERSGFPASARQVHRGGSMSEEERTPQQWAQHLGVKHHGMTDERWDVYLRYLEGEKRDQLAEVSARLLEEAKDLHAALRADKFARTENREQRRQLSRGLRELRHRRLNDVRDRYEALYDEGDDND